MVATGRRNSAFLTVLALGAIAVAAAGIGPGTVVAQPLGDAPTCTPIAPNIETPEADNGTTVTFAVQCDDADGDLLRLDWERDGRTVQVRMARDNETHTLSTVWDFHADASGDAFIVARATDRQGNTGSHGWTLTVVEPSDRGAPGVGATALFVALAAAAATAAVVRDGRATRRRD